MRLILTRPLERCQPLAERLVAEGDEVFIAPALRIGYIPVQEPTEPLQAVIFTSVQGVEAVASVRGFKIFPAFVVGSKTASAAHKIGFEHVYNAEGSSEDLFELILSKTNAMKGPLLHLCGEQIAGNLVEKLKERGFDARRQTVYEALAQESLPVSVFEKIRMRRFDAVLFFSTRSASIFCRIIHDHNLAHCFDHAEALTISDSVSKAVSALPWKRIYTAEQPTENAMLSMVPNMRR